MSALALSPLPIAHNARDRAWSPAPEVIGSNVAFALALQPLPPGCAYVEIAETGDAVFAIGDVARVDLARSDFVADCAYAVRIDGVEVIRRLQDCRDGMRVFWGSYRETFDPARMQILGIVDARISFERTP